MVRRTGRRRGNNRPRRGRIAKPKKIMFTGKSLKVGSVPTMKQEAPWNSVVLQKTVAVVNGGVYSLSGANIHTFLRAQIGLPVNHPTSIRVSKIKIFDLGSRLLEARLSDYTSSSPALRQILTAREYPGRMGFSSVGFQLPQAVAAHPVPDADVQVLNGGVGTPYGVSQTVTTDVLFHMYLLWRPLQTGSVSL